MQKHINRVLKCSCALDLRFFVGNIMGAKFPVEPVCETCLYAKCMFKRSEDQNGRSIYHVCRIDSISLIEKVALTSYLLSSKKKDCLVTGHRGSRDRRSQRSFRTWQNLLASQSRCRSWYPALFEQTCGNSPSASLSNSSLAVVHLTAFHFSLYLSARVPRSTQTHFHLSGVMSSLERIPPAADLLPKLDWCRAAETDLFC